MAFNPAGTRMAVGFAGGQVAVYDAHSGRKLESARLARGPTVNDVEFLGSTGVLAIATQHGVAVWLPHSRCCYVLPHLHQADTIAVDPQNPAEFAVTTLDGTVIWNLSSAGRDSSNRFLTSCGLPTTSRSVPMAAKF